VTTWHLFQAFALISEYISRDESIIRIGAILGLGIAYAGSQKEEVQFLYTPNLFFREMPPICYQNVMLVFLY
jgi:hypothetical protein